MQWSAVKKIVFTAYFLHLFAVNAVNRGELFIFTAFSVFLQKRIVPKRVRTCDLQDALHCLVHCANFHLHLSNFLYEFKSDWINFGNHMQWIFVRNAVNFCKKCGEMWWIIFFHHIRRFHRISYIILPQKLMRWIL